MHGLVQRGADDSQHRVVHRGREQQVLPLVGDVDEDLADLRPEAHVEHPVGLVEHEHLDVREVARRAEPTRSSRRPGVATSMSTPLLERRALRLVAHAAVDRGDADGR